MYHERKKVRGFKKERKKMVSRKKERKLFQERTNFKGRKKKDRKKNYSTILCEEKQAEVKQKINKDIRKTC